MIHSLRQRHCTIIIVLAVLIPAVFIVGLLVRKPAPVNHTLPPIMQGAPR